jgi:hypothetical protein
VLAEIERAATVGEPAHDDLVAADDLLAIDAQVLALLVRALRHDQAPCNQRCCIAGPASLDRQAREIDVVAFPDDLLARGAAHALGRHVPYGFGQREQLAGFTQAARRLRFLEDREHAADVAQILKRRCAHALRHPLCRAEQICQDRHLIDIAIVTARLLEQDGRAVRAQQAVADLGHFEVRRHRCCHAFQLATLLELAHKIAQVFVLHSEIDLGCGVARVMARRFQCV